jgi:hypothetical protein
VISNTVLVKKQTVLDVNTITPYPAFRKGEMKKRLAFRLILDTQKRNYEEFP